MIINNIVLEKKHLYMQLLLNAEAIKKQEELNSIKKENDIKELSEEELEILADEIREFLIQKISVTGGHLASNLGVVELPYGKSMVIADIPGLIEGASEGVGLGHEFLKHLERTRVLIHLVDAAALDGRDPVSDIEKINLELAKYSDKLAALPQVIGANKMDLPDAHFSPTTEKLLSKPELPLPSPETC